MIWWLGQLVALPVVALSEFLSVIGFRISGFFGFIILTFIIALVVVLPLLSIDHGNHSNGLVK